GVLLSTSLVHCAAPHASLHSFPTRRSSDLVGRSIATDTALRGLSPSALRPEGRREVFGHPADLVLGPQGAAPDHAIEHALPAPRSEEHTSELQSRVDLVCRLLLEKKKTNIS